MIAADILRAQGDDVDEARVQRAEALCEEPVDPPEPASSATPCCGQFDACTKACTPRGVHLGRKEVPDLYDVPGYEKLASVLVRAHQQAATGKGAERHAQGQRFDRQPMQDLIRLYGVGFALGQAAKKSQESMRLPTKERKVAELLGAIVYISGAIISIEQDE